VGVHRSVISARAAQTTGWRPRIPDRAALTGILFVLKSGIPADERTPWTTVRVEQWYGEGPREVEVAMDTAVWYHAGKPPVAIRWVLIRDPQQEFDPQALLSTQLDHTPTQRCAMPHNWTKSSLELFQEFDQRSLVFRT
jgi:hypothetical protein